MQDVTKSRVVVMIQFYVSKVVKVLMIQV